MNNQALRYTAFQRGIALVWGVICHGVFAVAIGQMMVSLYYGLANGKGPFQGGVAILCNLFLALLFGVLHSLMLSEAGGRWIGKLPLAGVGKELKTTTFAILASVQIFVTFRFWSPMGELWFRPDGMLLAVWTVAYLCSWVFLLRAMWNSGLALQTGFLGWWSVWCQKPVRFPGYAMRGLYRETRQPIYLGFAFVLWTGPSWTLDHFVLTSIWTAYCVVGPVFKERRFRKYATEGYFRYAATVPYWLPWPRKQWIEPVSVSEPVKADCDIIIVGAGPVGLTLAAILGQANHRVKVIERRSSRSVYSRAIGITPPSLEILNSIGVARAAVSEGLPIRRAYVFGDGGRAGKLTFDNIQGGFPYILSLPQTRLEELLEQRLAEMDNVTVVKGVEVERIAQVGGGGISLATSDGEIRGRFVAACDGRDSTMRRVVQMPVRSSETGYRFVMADFTDQSDLGSDAAMFFTGKGAVESFPLPSGQRRWILQVTGVETPDDEAIRGEVKSRAMYELESKDRISDWSWFQPEHLLCDRFFHGRVVFCGDAAHVLSPIGGQGMNLGLADAELAAYSFGELLKGPPSLRILEDYDRKRRRAFLRARRFTSAGMWIGTRYGENVSGLREVLISTALQSKKVHDLLANRFAMRTRGRVSILDINLF